MKLTITCTETLETIYTQKDLHPVLQGLLRQITFQERVETNFQTSLRAKNSFSEWVAGLIAINPTASLTNGKKMPLTTLLEHEAGSLKEFKEIQLDLAELKKVIDANKNEIEAVEIYINNASIIILNAPDEAIITNL